MLKWVSWKLSSKYYKTRPDLDVDDWVGICTDVLLLCQNNYDKTICKFSHYFYVSCVMYAKKFATDGGCNARRDATNVDIKPHYKVLKPPKWTKLDYDEFKEIQRYLSRRQWGIIYDRYVRGWTLTRCAESRDLTRQAVSMSEQEAFKRLKRLKTIKVRYDCLKN